jgi:site-specific DNA recombinase
VVANKELAKARKLILAEDIEPADFRAIKTECEDKIARLEAKISALSQEFNSLELKELLVKATTAVSNLHQLYHDGDVFYKRQMISALFPQNLEYDGFGFRTAHLNEVIETIFNLDVTFRKENSVQNGRFSILYAKEVPNGFEPP